MSRLRTLLATLLLVPLLAGAVAAVAVPTPAAAAGGCDTRFLTMPPWYRGLTNNDCSIVSPDAVGGIGPFIWRIVFNLVDIMMQVAGYVAVGFILFGGFLYMTSNGLPDRAAQALKTIINAAIGLIIAIASVAIVNLIAGAARLPT